MKFEGALLLAKETLTHDSMSSNLHTSLETPATIVGVLIRPSTN